MRTWTGTCGGRTGIKCNRLTRLIPPRACGAVRGVEVRTVVLFALALTACTRVGPDFVLPSVPLEAHWLEVDDPPWRRCRDDTRSGGRRSTIPF
jgi:hypothetical protein